MKIDRSYSDLPDDELADLLARDEREKKADAWDLTRIRMERNSFHWVGGLPYGGGKLPKKRNPFR